MRRLLVYFAPPPPPPRVCVLSTCYDEDSRGRGGKRGGGVEKLGNAGVASELKKNPHKLFLPPLSRELVAPFWPRLQRRLANPNFLAWLSFPSVSSAVGGCKAFSLLLLPCFFATAFSHLNSSRVLPLPFLFPFCPLLLPFSAAIATVTSQVFRQRPHPPPRSFLFQISPLSPRPPQMA